MEAEKVGIGEVKEQMMSEVKDLVQEWQTYG